MQRKTVTLCNVKIHCNTPSNTVSFSLTKTEGGKERMLSMDDIKYIKRLYEKEDVSIREIMRRTGYHYETVKKYLDMEDFNEPNYPPKEIPSLLDSLKPIIDEWLTEDLKAPRKQRHTAKRVYARLLKEHPELLQVKLRTVQYYVSKKKKELYENHQKAYLPLYHPPGEAQVDFGHFAYYDNAGIMQDAMKLTMSYPYSNASYCQIFHGENQECLLQGMKNILEHMNLVPYRMVFDNLSTAVSHMGKGHDRTLTDSFARFIAHYGIDTFFCNGAAGWEKGNVENKVGYERRNLFVPVPTILDFDQFNGYLFKASEEDIERQHYSKHESIAILFAEDKKSMLPLNPVPFEVCRFESRIADKYGKVMFDGNLYSSSPKSAKESVYIKVDSDMVTVLDHKYQIIVEHKRLYGKGNESMNWLPYIELMSKRPTAIKYTGFYDELPKTWKNYLAELPADKKREALMTLHIILQKHDMRTAADALNATLASGVKDADSVLVSYHRLINGVQQMHPMQLPSTIIQMPAFKSDNQKYDDFFRQEAAK